MEIRAKSSLFFILMVLALPETNGDTIYVNKGGVNNNTCCSSNTPCISLELAFRCVHLLPHITDVTVLISSGSYVLPANRSLTTFDGWSEGIAIEGVLLNNSNDSGVIITCETGAGLSFVNSANITLRNLNITGCGQLQNSTSRNFFIFKQSAEFLKISTGVYFLLCRDVTIISTTISKTNGTGLVMYSTVGEVTIQHSYFQNNSMSSETQEGGGGLYIEFGYCLAGDTSCANGDPNVPINFTSGAHYTIADCVFEHNVGSVSSSSERSTFILPQKSDHYAFGRGGGLSVFFKGIAQHNIIIVNNSVFSNNRALWGGGIFLDHQDSVSMNQFSVYNTILDSNYLFHKSSHKRGTGGGGSRVGFIFFNDAHVYNNSIHFENCRFVNNKAYFGGGLSFYTAREPQTSTPSNSLDFTRCEWTSNVARAGSALDLSVWHPSTHGAVVNVGFNNCRFESNRGSYTSAKGQLRGIGAMYLDSIPIEISGSTVFNNNTHSALAAGNTGIYFESGSDTSFTNNSGHNGGAISLMGFAFLEMGNHSSIAFINNTAHFYGGAIFGQSIGEHDLISSRNCFIRYYDIISLPQQWECKFYFEGNKANEKPNSIYATSLLPCLWGSVYGSVEANASEVFCWNDTVWNYTTSNCEDQIQTSAARFTEQSELTVIPGKIHTLPVTMVDDRDSDVTSATVFSARSLSSNLEIDSSSEYISNDQIKVFGRPYSNASFTLSTVDPRVVDTTVKVHIQPCPLGMYTKQIDQTQSVTCKCNGTFNGHVSCNPDTFSTSIKSGYWIGPYTPTSSNKTYVVVGACPYCSTPLNLDLGNCTINNNICNSLNRRGTLCGKCEHGYSPSVNAFGLVCANCSDISPLWSLFILIFRDLGLIAVLFFLFFFFDIKIVSARANALMFFAQVVPIAFTIDAAGTLQVFKNNTRTQMILTGMYKVPLSVFNLDLDWFSLCLSPNLSPLAFISLGYVIAAFPLLLILIVLCVSEMNDYGVRPVRCLLLPLQYLMHRFHQRFRIKANLAHTFATFLQLSYTRFTLVSFFLLNRTPVYDNGGHAIGPGVVYYDGTLDYLRGGHIKYFLIAMVVMLIFVILPPVVLFNPIVNGKKLVNCVKGHIHKLASFNKPKQTQQDEGERELVSAVTRTEVSIQELVANCDTITTEGSTEPTRNSDTTTQSDPDMENCQGVIVPNHNHPTTDTTRLSGFYLFLETFHGEFKDGSQDREGSGEKKSDRRWFAGLYFALRFAVFAVFAFTTNRFMQLAFQQFICIFALIMFLTFRPYKKKKDFYNKVDAFMFAVLILLNTFTMYNFYLNEAKGRPIKAVFIFQFLLIFGYLLFSICFIVYRWRLKRRRRSNVQQGQVNNVLRPYDNAETDNLLETADERRSYHGHGYGAIPSLHEDGECSNDGATYHTARSTNTGFDTAKST